MLYIFRCILLVIFLCVPVYVGYAFSFSNPLINAADQGRESVVLRYLNAGKPVDAKGDFGVTALMRASFRGYVPIVEVLLQRGAFPDTTDIGGATALHLAARNGYAKVVRSLIKGKASIDAQDREMWTPLMRAVIADRIKVVEALIEEGADVSLVNQLDESAVVHSATVGSVAMLEALSQSPMFEKVAAEQLQTARFIAEQNGNLPFLTALDNLSASQAVVAEQGDVVDAVEIGEEVEVSEDAAPLVEEDAVEEVEPVVEEEPVSEPTNKILEKEEVEKPVTPSDAKSESKDVPVVQPKLKPVEKAPIVPAEPKEVPVKEVLEPLSIEKETAPKERKEVEGLPWKDSADYSSQYDIASSIFDSSVAFKEEEVASLDEKEMLQLPKDKTGGFAPDAQGGFFVQLGTFLAEDVAYYSWENIKRDNQDLLRGLEPQVTKSFIAKEHVTLFRLRAGGFESRSKANDFCDVIRSREMECFVVETEGRTDTMAVKEVPEEGAPQSIASPEVDSMVNTAFEEEVVDEESSFAPIALNQPINEMPAERKSPEPVVAESAPSSTREWAPGVAEELVVAEDLIPGLPWLSGSQGTPAPLTSQAVVQAPYMADVDASEQPAQVYAPVQPLMEPEYTNRGANIADSSIEGIYVPGRGGDYSKVYDPMKKYPVMVQASPRMPSPSFAQGELVYQAPEEGVRRPYQPSMPQDILKEARVTVNPDPVDMVQMRKHAAQEVLSDARESYFSQHGVKTAPQRYKEYGDFYQNIKSQSQGASGVSEAIPVPDSAYFSEIPGGEQSERIVENWLQIGEFTNEQRAKDYWLRMFKYNASLNHLKMVLFKPVSESGMQTASIRVGPLSAGKGFEICDTVKTTGKKCTVVSSDSVMGGGYSKEGSAFKEVPKSSKVYKRWINLGAFADRREAEYYWMFLKDDHQDVLANMKHVFDSTEQFQEFGDTATKLKIGPFTTPDRAQQVCSVLLQRNVACLVSK